MVPPLTILPPTSFFSSQSKHHKQHSLNRDFAVRLKWVKALVTSETRGSLFVLDVELYKGLLKCWFFKCKCAMQEVFLWAGGQCRLPRADSPSLQEGFGQGGVSRLSPLLWTTDAENWQLTGLIGT
jgi:hypothetical protein